MQDKGFQFLQQYCLLRKSQVSLLKNNKRSLNLDVYSMSAVFAKAFSNDELVFFFLIGRNEEEGENLNTGDNSYQVILVLSIREMTKLLLSAAIKDFKNVFLAKSYQLTSSKSVATGSWFWDFRGCRSKPGLLGYPGVVLCT